MSLQLFLKLLQKSHVKFYKPMTMLIEKDKLTMPIEKDKLVNKLNLKITQKI